MRWKQGECIGATGNKCLYRHYYLERDSRIVPAQRSALAEVDPANFSSPYQVKICKEKLTHRREEVDIETGRRRSWVEEEEREVFDLTGDTPAKPMIKARSKSAHGNRYEGSPPPTLALTPMRTTRRSSIILSDSPSSTPLPVPRRKSGSTSNPPRNPPPMQVKNMTFTFCHLLFPGNPSCRPDSCSNSYPHCSRNMPCVSQVPKHSLLELFCIVKS